MNIQRATLTPAEMDALREVSKGALQEIIAPQLEARLIDLKLIRETLGGLQITPEGRRHLTGGR